MAATTVLLLRTSVGCAHKSFAGAFCPLPSRRHGDICVWAAAPFRLSACAAECAQDDGRMNAPPRLLAQPWFYAARACADAFSLASWTFEATGQRVTVCR